jgi:energy-coupling factor transport system permease protein
MNNFDITIGQYVKGNSLLHKLDPRFKILATIILMVSIFLVPTTDLNNIYILLGFLGFFLLVFIISKINLLAVIKGLQPIVFIGLFTFGLQLIYNNTGTKLSTLNFNFSFISIIVAVLVLVVWYFTSKFVSFKMLYMLFMLAVAACALIFIKTDFDFYSLPFEIYSDGLLRGAFFFLRIVLVVMLSTMLTISTSTIDINLGLEWILHPLTFIKIPVAVISMMLSLTLRFIPTLVIETNKIMKAQASRGIDFQEGSLVEKVKQVVTLLVPMFFISFTRAEDLANAMEARGYIVGDKRTCIDQLKFRAKDYVSFVVVLLILASTIVLRVL